MKIGLTVRPRRVSEKKRTWQSKKPQRRYTSPTWGESPTEPICTEICTIVTAPTQSRVRSFELKFSGVTVLERVEFRIVLSIYWFLHGPYNSAPLVRWLCLLHCSLPNSQINRLQPTQNLIARQSPQILRCRTYSKISTDWKLRNALIISYFLIHTSLLLLNPRTCTVCTSIT